MNVFKILTAVWCLLILYLSWNPGIQVPEGFWDNLPLDKIGHFGIYSILAMIVSRGFTKWNNKLIFLLCTAYGISMELLQYAFFPGRYFEWLDILANSLGAIAGIILIKKLIT